MPLVYEKAMERQSKIANNITLKELEVSGFVKCIARQACVADPDKAKRMQTLRQSIEKQFNDLRNASGKIPTLEALADLRNVCGLMFLEQLNEADSNEP
jgi:hypothetical protein